jgi:nitrate reductase gamma subunit
MSFRAPWIWRSFCVHIKAFYQDIKNQDCTAFLQHDTVVAFTFYFRIKEDLLSSVLISAFIIIAMICFVLISLIRALRYNGMPTHGRLEIYPVPKEGGGRAEYGGSYMEEVQWYNKPRQVSHAGELIDMMKEMLFIKKLFENQRSLWWASYAFHLGIYVLIAFTLLLILAALWTEPLLITFATIVGVAGFALATLGSFLLLVRRMIDATLRKYTTPQEYFNILLIFAVLVTGIISWTVFADPFKVAAGILAFGASEIPAFVLVHLVLLGIMFIYIPISKMSHYVGKYFSFHKVLWDNDPNFVGNKVNESMRRDAQNPPQHTWSAPHINPPTNVEE